MIIGSLVSLPVNFALAVSLLKRARDLIKGVPALLHWQLIERREFHRVAADPPLAYPQEEV